MKEMKILGAGLSGLTAAINLAKEGYRVDVYEKYKDVG
jgi:phytoene dehydrogenase-like protein